MSKLFFVALACLVACVAADASNTTQIQRGVYTDATCTTVQSFQIFNSTAGDCVGGFSATYTDGTSVYSYLYATGSNCAAANISLAVKYTAGICGAADTQGHGFVKYTIFSNTVNPSIPTGAFPPAGFVSTTQYINSTVPNQGDNGCSSSITVVTATPAPASTNPCQQYDDKVGSRQSFVASDCLSAATFYYSDNACANLVKTASVTLAAPKSCDNGYKSVCAGAGIPSSSLTLSLVKTDNMQCAANLNTLTQTALDGGCFRGQATTCTSANSTQYLTSTAYSNMNCTGDVTRTTYIPTGLCIQSGDFQNYTASCSAQPQGGSASTVGVSAIVMIAAAFVALVAGRQL